MSAVVARYGAVALPGANKASRLKPDDTGYYRCILGGFNVTNNSGIYYPLVPEVKAMFEKGGIVRRRLDAGILRGEYGHPKIENLPLKEALKRLAVIDPLLTSHHIRNLELVDAKDEYGRPIVLVVGWVRPTGPYGAVLKEQLDNPEENVSFSVRSFISTIVQGGRQVRIIKDVLTYDFVTEGGIAKATQFSTAGLEEFHEMIILPDTLNEAIHTANAPGLESEFSTLSMVRDSLGWSKVEVVNLRAIDWGI